MAEENYSTYQWEPVDDDRISFSSYNIKDIKDSDEKQVTIKATITKTDIFALIAGTYQVTVEVRYETDGPTENQEPNSEPKNEILEDGLNVKCITTEIQSNPKLCTGSSENYTVELTLTGETENLPQGARILNNKYTPSNFSVQQGINNDPNKYLCILRKPKLITNLSIDGRSVNNTYVKGSALPINEIQNISTIDFQDIKINDVQRDIFYKLNSIGGENIVTNNLSVPELTVVDLPESENEPIIICKSRSKNKGVTFKTKDPDIGRKHFGYVIDIKDYRSAGYNSVWVNRKTLDKIFTGMPADIMSNTDMFKCTDSFNFHELTYEVHDVAVSNWVNNQGQEFTPDDRIKLNTYAPTYKAVTINQSTGDSIRHNDMLLKNIEFVKFGEKVIKLNYKPLYEA